MNAELPEDWEMPGKAVYHFPNPATRPSVSAGAETKDTVVSGFFCCVFCWQPTLEGAKQLRGPQGTPRDGGKCVFPAGRPIPGQNQWWLGQDSAMWLQQSPSKVLELIKRIKSTIWTLSSLLIGSKGRLERTAYSEIKRQRPPGWEWRKWPRGAHGAHKLVTSDRTQSEELRPFSALLGWCNVSKCRLFFNTIQSLTWTRLLPKMYSCWGQDRRKTSLPLRTVQSHAFTKTHPAEVAWSTFRVRQRRSTAWWWPVSRLPLTQASDASKSRAAFLLLSWKRLLGRDWTSSWDKRTFRDSEQETLVGTLSRKEETA